jgi:hypothetical protein
MSNPTTNNICDTTNHDSADQGASLPETGHETLEPNPAPQTLDHLETSSDSRAASNDASLVPAQPSATGNTEIVAQKKLVRPAGSRGAEQLLHFVADYDLFHSPEHIGFADIKINGHRETFALNSKEFKSFLEHDFYKKTGAAPSPDAVTQTVNILKAQATYDAPERPVHVRVAQVAQGDRCFYLDLGDGERRAIEITATGWSVVDNPSVRFCRPAGMRLLPVPEKGGSIDELRQFLNVQDDNDFVLIVAWLLAAFRPQGPYAVLAVSGGQGSAKSSLSKLVRSLVDPNVSPARSIPSNGRDIFIAAKSGHVVAFDNISGLSNWISDALCQLATGAGYVARQLRTDSDQVFFEASRPIILNGIGGFIDRADLADRTIFVSLPPILSYRPEDELRDAFDAARPRILGALLDGVVHGLQTLPNVPLNNCWRMADFAKFATACEGAFRTPGTFAAAYSNNREQAIGEMLDADPIADAVVGLMKTTAKWQGTAAHLLGALANVAGSGARERGWPKIPGQLSRRLTRSEPLLRGRGIEVTRERAGRKGDRLISLTKYELES